ncbi:MAG: signal peptidase II [Methylacidiphilales bacterium]|nr:signal peptidase II [Candidatus Methylacidiphilales bacterium]
MNPDKNLNKAIILRFSVIASIIFLLDMLTKYLVLTFSPYHLGITPYLSFIKVYNYGASFSLGSSFTHYANYFLLAVSVLVIIVIVIQVIKQKSFALHQTNSLGLIVGGALGNSIDRIRFGAVFDFISVHYNSWYYPTFNLADSAITIGAILYIWNSLTSHK